MCEKNPQKSLIDFSSPLQERLDTETLVPLVPSPQFKQVNKKETVSLESELISAVGNISDEDNNPFDLVDRQTNLNVRMLNDPFELAFYLSDETQVPPCDPSSQIKEDKENLDSSTASELVVLVSSFNDGIINQSDQSLGILNERICNLSDSSLIGIDNITDPCKELRISLSEISMNANVSSLLGKKTEFDNVGKKIDFENMNLSLSEEDARDEGNGSLTSSDSKADDADDSDQALKAIIANRVSVCIQNALQRSRVSRGSFIVNAETTTDQSGLPTTQNTSYLQEYPQKEKGFTGRKTSFYETDKNPLIKYEWKPIQRRSIGSFRDTESYSSFNKPLLVAKNLRQSFTNLVPTNFNYSAQEIMKGVDGKNTSYTATNSMKTESFMKYYEEKMKQTGINHGVTENGLKNLKNELKRYNDRIPVTDTVTPDGLVSEITDKEYGDDSVFLEANNMAFMFRSFTLPANDGENDDILTCKPQWETSYLNLPELCSDDDESKGNPHPEVHSKQKLLIEDLINAKVGTRYSKEAQGPPDIVLQPLVPLIEKNEMQLRIKPKQVQQLGKKGPMKAIVPLGNMVRTAGIEKKVFPHGSQDQTDVDSSPDFLPKTSDASSTIQDTPKTKGLKTAKGTAWKADGGSKNKFGNRSFTSSSNPSPVPNLRRSSSLTSGIPALAAPAVSLKSQFLPQNADNQMPNQKSMSDQKSKSSSNVGRFSLPGFVATSTPAKKMSFTAANRLLVKSLPSPIPVKGSKKNSPTEVPKNAKSENAPKNKSFDGSQQMSNEKGSHNQSHSRSKSASNACSSKLLQNRKGSPKEVTKSNAGKSFNLKSPSQLVKSPPELKVVPSGILKPLKINGQSRVGRQIVDAKKPVSIPGSDVKRTRPLLQMFSKLKGNSYVQVDKENMKPA